MKGLLSKFYSMYGRTIDDYLCKERAKKLIWKRHWPAMMLRDPGILILLSHQSHLSRLATYSAYLAANEEALNNLKGRLAYENE